MVVLPKSAFFFFSCYRSKLFFVGFPRKIKFSIFGFLINIYDFNDNRLHQANLHKQFCDNKPGAQGTSKVITA